MANTAGAKRPIPAQNTPAAKRQSHGRLRSAPRASQACHACASSKTKCDNKPTCERCRIRNVPCIRNCHLLDQLDEPRDRVTVENAAVRSQISSKRTRAIPMEGVGHVGDMADVVSTPHSAAPLNDGVNSHATQQAAHDMIDHHTDTTLPPPPWNFDATFDLFALDNGLDWGLSAHEVDFLSSLELPLSNDAIDHPQDPQDPQTALASPIFSNEDNACSFTVQQAFCQSIGQWTPDSGHYRAHGEKNMVSEDLINLKMDVLGQWDPFISSEMLVPRTRDKLVAMAVASCEPGNISAIVSAFPAVEILERLINISLTEQKGAIDSYIHVQTFSKIESHVETLAALVINGTNGSSSKAVHKFAHGLGEILSCYLHSRAERNYCLTRDLQYLQAFSLSLHYDLWGGIKNKMELAGSLVGVLINMLRVGGRFRRTSYPAIVPSSTDVGDILDKKWRAWVVQESFKRLVYHTHIHCVQGSFMASTTGPQLAASELSLPLPESRELWLAPSANHWKQAYLRLQPSGSCRVPSVLDCVGDPGKAHLLPQICDQEFANLAQLYTIASLVRNFKLTQPLFTTKDPAFVRSNLIADESQERRMIQIIQVVGMGYSICEPQEAARNLLCELASMHLHSSFEQIEIFAGRDGPDEAQSAYPVLYSWCQSPSSRYAVCHAGQVLRHMRAIPVSSLHIFYALACYQASLCLCVYGCLSKISTSRSVSLEPLCAEPEIVLNGEQSQATQRWTLLSTGVPMLASATANSEPATQPDRRIALSSTDMMMSMVIEIVRTKFRERSDTTPLLVDNICRLMQSIGKAVPN